VNCVSPMCGAPDNGLAGLGETGDSPAALRFAVKRGLVERERCKELRAALPVPQILIPRITQWLNDLDLLARIGDGMDFSQYP